MLQVAAQDYAFKVHLLPLVQACEAVGFRVICCSQNTGLAAELPIEHIHIPFSRSFDIAQHLKCTRMLAALIRREGVEIVHGHTLIGGLLARLAARIRNVPAVAYTAHGFHFHEHMSLPPRALYGLTEWVAALSSDLIFFQNEEDRKTALRWRMGTPEHLVGLPGGIDLERFDPSTVSRRALNELRYSLNIPPGAPIVTFVGRPTRDKGFDVFCALGKRLARDAASGPFFVSSLVILPGERMPLADLVYEIAHDARFRVLRFRNDVPELLALSDVFVLPSRYEGCSRSTMEAMAMGTPAVCYDVRGCRELITSGKTGYLVPFGDFDGLSETVRVLLEDDERRIRLGRAAREWAAARFSHARSLALQVARLEQLHQRHRERRCA